jgi:hypothetical protein
MYSALQRANVKSRGGMGCNEAVADYFNTTRQQEEMEKITTNIRIIGGSA